MPFPAFKLYVYSNSQRHTRLVPSILPFPLTALTLLAGGYRHRRVLVCPDTGHLHYTHTTYGRHYIRAGSVTPPHFVHSPNLGRRASKTRPDRFATVLFSPIHPLSRHLITAVILNLFSAHLPLRSTTQSI